MILSKINYSKKFLTIYLNITITIYKLLKSMIVAREMAIFWKYEVIYCQIYVALRLIMRLVWLVWCRSLRLAQKFWNPLKDETDLGILLLLDQLPGVPGW